MSCSGVSSAGPDTPAGSGKGMSTYAAVKQWLAASLLLGYDPSRPYVRNAVQSWVLPGRPPDLHRAATAAAWQKAASSAS